MKTDLKQRLAKCLDGDPLQPLPPTYLLSLLVDCRTHIEAQDQELSGYVRKLAETVASCAAMREEHVMQLAGISTASIQNTESTRKDRITPDNPYYTTAYADVCRAVDREMELRSRLQAVEKLLAAAKCPTCDGSGGYPVMDSHGEPQLEQCQWCDERKALQPKDSK